MVTVSSLSFWLSSTRLLLLIDQSVRGHQLIYGNSLGQLSRLRIFLDDIVEFLLRTKLTLKTHQELRSASDGIELWAVNGIFSRKDFLYRTFAGLIITLSTLLGVPSAFTVIFLFYEKVLKNFVQGRSSEYATYA